VSAAAPATEWSGHGVTVGAIERELGALREEATADGPPELRASVLTLIALSPPGWVEAATETLAGLAERHPSRTLIVVPQPEEPESRLDARISLHCFDLGSSEQTVCSEVIELRLLGARAAAPASVAAPLLVADLPAFLRWRGRPTFGTPQLERFARLVDRLVVDSGEWDDPAADFPLLAELFEQVAVSDIAWARTLRWRLALAGQWPAVGAVDELRVRGPRAEALLLAGWLRSRLERRVELVHDPAEAVEAVAWNGNAVTPPAGEPPTASDLLSEELDRFDRDPVYEAALQAA
jgi:glucose-6-phosphate dehydrogenase assembly protein OpcA